VKFTQVPTGILVSSRRRATHCSILLMEDFYDMMQRLLEIKAAEGKEAQS
jgi:hypothetical protein